MCRRRLAFGCAFVYLVMLGSSFAIHAQTPTPSPKPSPTPTPKTAFGQGFKRWIDVDGFTLSTRYRYIKTNGGVVTNNQQQWQTQFRPRFKFDRAGRYSVAGFMGTGNSFTSGWINLGPGTGKLQTNVYVKQLFFDAKPVKQLELQVGGIAINFGENSEVTAYDNDNYITGERVLIREPRHVWFDEISATNAFLGDINKPSIFGRLHRMGQANYHQFLFRKQVAKAVGFSADYTFDRGSDTIREAVRVKPKSFLLTTILFDAYERVSDPTGNGFDIFGERVFNKHWTVNGGFARIDRRLTLNADKFPPGKRLYANLTYKPTPEFSITPSLIQAVGPLPTAATHRTRFDLVLTWNVLESLHRHHVL